MNVGMILMGCILCADNILLLFGSCFGLQKMVDICSNCGHRFDIKFNPLKSQTTVFDKPAPSGFVLNLNY